MEKKISKSSEGFDMGCGTGRWAKFIAPKVGKLQCMRSIQCNICCKKKLQKFKNVKNYHKNH